MKFYLITLLIVIIISCGPRTTYLLRYESPISKIELEKNISLTEPIDTLYYKRITNKDVQKLSWEVIRIIETYFKMDSTLFDDKIHLESILSQISKQQKTKKECLSTYCIAGGGCLFPLVGVYLGMMLDGTSYAYLMPFVPPLTLISYLFGGLFIKKWQNKLVIDSEDIKKINEVILKVNAKMNSLNNE